MTDIRYPAGRPGWLGEWQPWPCGRCGEECDEHDRHDCDPANLERNLELRVKRND